MLATTISFLSTVAVQIGAAAMNSSHSRKHNEEMARKQRAFDEKMAREGIDNARAEFAELCKFQKELDAEMHRERLNVIRESARQNISLDAYAQSLANWPLMVPPYVLKNESLYDSEYDENYTIPLNCILTGSSNMALNSSVMGALEENLADFCSQYWNVANSRSVRFLQEAWRNPNVGADSTRLNLYVHLKNIPTLVLSPVVKEDRRLVFRFYWWGMSPDAAQAHINGIDEFDPEITMPSVFPVSEEDRARILDECTPKLAALISYFADLYYWNFYRLPPVLPGLISSGAIGLSRRDVQGYATLCGKSMAEFCDSDDCLYLGPQVSAEYFASLSHIVNRVFFAAYFRKYLAKKKKFNVLNCCELSSLEMIQCQDRLLPVTERCIREAIEYIHRNEEIGYFPCIGKFEFGQTLLNRCVAMGAEYAVLQHVADTFTYVRFYGGNGDLLVSADGFRSFVASHPRFAVTGTQKFEPFSCTFTQVSDNNAACQDVGISKDDVEELVCTQKKYADKMTAAFNAISGYFGEEGIPTLEPTFADVLAAMRSMRDAAPGAVNAELSVGYNPVEDKYGIAVCLLDADGLVLEGVVCYSNVIHKSIREQLADKTTVGISQYLESSEIENINN